MTATKRMRLAAVTRVADGTSLFAFEPADGHRVAPAMPGAHIDLHLPSGVVRQYSLVMDPSQRHPVVVAVKREPSGRGGSRWLHESILVGDEIEVGGPRNNFPLIEDAPHTLLIAGGIGITPIWSMLNRLQELGQSHELYYACRTRTEMAFAEPLAAQPNVHLHIDDEAGTMLDIAGICAGAAATTHLYCCGPAPMLQVFESATAGRVRGRIHVESFAAREEAASEGGFEVVLARSGRILEVLPGERILDSLRGAGIDVLVSCEQGVCGSCETRVLEGIPDHRCQVLSEDERAAGQTMMVCCSGTKTGRLVLDL